MDDRLALEIELKSVDANYMVAGQSWVLACFDWAMHEYKSARVEERWRQFMKLTGLNESYFMIIMDLLRRRGRDLLIEISADQVKPGLDGKRAEG